VSEVLSQGGVEEDVKRCIRQVNREVRRTKLRLFNSNVKAVLLYGCEMCKVTEPIIRQLQVITNRCLWWVLNMRWSVVLSSEDLWEMTNNKSNNRLKRGHGDG
jgi:hypothetical protein